MQFSIQDFFPWMWSNLQETADLVAFTEEILNGKINLFVYCSKQYRMLKND